MSQIRIVKGEQKVFKIKLRTEDGDPFDLTNYNKYRVTLPKGAGQGSTFSEVANGNGSVVALSGNAILGTLQVTIKKQDTALLAANERLSIDIEIDNSGTPAPRRARFADSLVVVDSLIPNT